MSSIEISTHNLTAPLASPFSVGKRERLVYPAARVATLGGGEEPINLPEMYSIPFGFVLDLTNEFTPSCIGNRLGKMVVRHYPLHVQVFGKDRLALAYQPMT